MHLLLFCNDCLGTIQREVAIDCLAKGCTPPLNEAKLTSFKNTISSLQESVVEFSAVSPIRMKYSDAARTAPSFVDSTSSENRISGIPETTPSNQSQKASRMNIITHEENSINGILNHIGLEASDIVCYNRLGKFKEKSSRP